ncbi:MAG: aromatic ring-hydroxylating oxygenase subunit alpha, partial [Candidatus Binatia bacterium]
MRPSPNSRSEDSGIVLTDGTTLRELIDVEKREVSLRVLTDPELYQRELERLFAKAWVGIAHESEIPNCGDFVLRYVGEDSVIVVRQTDGTIVCMLNVCAHRGMQVCRTDSGTASSFRCPYHGWLFGQDGRYLGAPFEKEMYGDALDKPSLGLHRARVGTYAGIVFVTWDLSAPSLEDYLGDIKWYLDLMFARTDAGLEVVGCPQRFIVRANWKCASEQWAGDGYHGATLHRSIEELGLGKSASLEVLVGINVSTREGHG